MQHRPKKSLGQHFLTSPHYAEVMCDAAEVHTGEVVVEIGPGQGVLTRVLLARGAQVVAIEKDDHLYTMLQNAFEREIDTKALRLIHADVLDTKDYELPAHFKLIANIPYNITGEILRLFLGGPHQPESATLLIQKEVAERILARDQKQSLLSLSVSVFGTPRIVAKVSKGNFSPVPKVDSAILHISSISRSFFKNKEEERGFFELIRAGFAHKRKKLSSNIVPLYQKTSVSEAFFKLSIEENARAEDIMKENWLSLLRSLQSRG